MTRLAALLVVLLGASSAWAQTGGDRALIEQGRALRRAGRNVDALESFRAAYALRPTPEAAGQIGFAEHALERWEPAWRHLREALAEPRDPWVQAQREALEFSLRAVEAHLGSLRVETAAPGASAEVVGGAVIALPMREPLCLAAGTVTLETRAPGHRTDRREVTVAEGETVRVVVNLAPESAPAPEPAVRVVVVPAPGMIVPRPVPAPAPAPPNRTLRTLAWIAVGTGVAFLGGGAAAMAVRDHAAERWNDDARCLAPGRSREELCGDDRALVGTADALMIAGYAAGAVLVVSGVIGLATASASRGESRVSVGVGPGAASVALRF